MTDDELLHRFESADLEDLRHVDHLRVAWAYLERVGPAPALDVMREGLRRFTVAKGAPHKLHHTLTRAWLTLIADARQRHPSARTVDALLSACPLLADPRAMDRFYSADTIQSEHARLSWVEPDRAALVAETPIPSPSSRATPMPNADPFVVFQEALARARSHNIDPTPTTLATADSDGRPSARMVLLRGSDARGFVFHTNYTSRKARELTENPHAALCLHWPTLEEQIRIEGTVTRLPPDESDAYFAGRPRGSQIGAWASEQSQPLAERRILEERLVEVERRFDGQPVPRPPFWGGFRLTPARIEFWQGRTDRLHDRLVYLRDVDGWRTERLFP